jgi:hypothetical protein
MLPRAPWPIDKIKIYSLLFIADVRYIYIYIYIAIMYLHFPWYIMNKQTKTNSVALSPQANYTDWATAIYYETVLNYPEEQICPYLFVLKDSYKLCLRLQIMQETSRVSRSDGGTWTKQMDAALQVRYSYHIMLLSTPTIPGMSPAWTIIDSRCLGIVKRLAGVTDPYVWTIRHPAVCVGRCVFVCLNFSFAGTVSIWQVHICYNYRREASYFVLSENLNILFWT